MHWTRLPVFLVTSLFLFAPLSCSESSGPAANDDGEGTAAATTGNGGVRIGIPNASCSEDSDCFGPVGTPAYDPTATCVDSQCVPGHCSDAQLSSGEVGIDCGGSCPPCASGSDCTQATDCQTGCCDRAGLCSPDENGNGICDTDDCTHPHQIPPDCSQCEAGFAGPNCDQCADPHFSGPNCTDCSEGFTGPNCGECADPVFTGPDCTQCADPTFTGPACSECADSAFTGPNCDQCVNPKLTGENCDQCLDPTYTGPNCEQCADSTFTGPHCDQCANSTFTGPNCDQCADSKFTGPNCGQCVDSTFTGPNCDQCADSTFTGPNCDQCADSKFTGANCDQCADPKYTGPDCMQCTNPEASGPDCTVCAPTCLPGWECGPDGCGGNCGAGCAGLETCNLATHVCEPPLPNSGLFGQSCGRKDTCQPGEAAWPTCLNSQCQSGYCLEPACSKACILATDFTDAFGNPGPDGIDDPNTLFSDCGGAAEGPMGTDFTCVTVAGTIALCLPGTTFQPCMSTADCSGSETCQLHFVQGTYGSRCATPPKNAVGIGEYCNENPNAGPLSFCETNLCLGIGCSGFCQQDSDCQSPAFECRIAHNLIGDPLEPTFDVCLGSSCTVNTDCPGAHTYCDINGTGFSGPQAGWDHLCAAAAPNAAKLGETCDNDDTDATILPQCAGPCLNNGTCSAICDSDADCASAPGMKCNLNEIEVDYNNDGLNEQILPLGLCVAFPGTAQACSSDSDCPLAEACSFHSLVSANGVYDGEGVCTQPAPGDAAATESCSTSQQLYCESGFCLSQNDPTPGFCASLCNSVQDCPQGVSLGLFSGTYNNVCRALLYGEATTIDQPEDDVYVSLCVPVDATQSSLSDCSMNWSGCPGNQACRAFAIGHGATGPTSMEMLCVSAAGTNALNQPIVPTATLGQSCDVTQASPTGTYCLSDYCLPEPSNPAAGYCSQLCNDDTECGGLTCQDFMLLDRSDDTQDVVIGLCQKP